MDNVLLAFLRKMFILHNFLLISRESVYIIYIVYKLRKR